MLDGVKNTMYKFKEGDKVRVKYNCSGAIRGVIYTLVKIHGKILMTQINETGYGCTCTWNWILVSPRVIKEFGIVKFMRETSKERRETNV